MPSALKDNIAALKQRFRVREPQLPEVISQVGHRDKVVAADVNASEKRHIFHNSVLLIRMQSIVMPSPTGISTRSSPA